jgi:uncharacterized protein YpiB (UPF0302 family)
MEENIEKYTCDWLGKSFLNKIQTRRCKWVLTYASHNKRQKNLHYCHVWWHVSVILATQEAEARGSQGLRNLARLYLIKKKERKKERKKKYGWGCSSR